MRKGQPKELMNMGMFGEAVEAILEGMDKTVGSLKSQMNTRFEKLIRIFENYR